MLDPDGGAYLKVPYRTLAHPPVTLWEQQAAVARLREQGRTQVDETALFRMVEQLRTITDTAAATTRRARRDAQRRAATPAARIAAPSIAGKSSQHLNLLWDDGRLSAILDWDRLGIRPIADEIARTATLVLVLGAETGALDLPRTAAFIAAYRHVNDLDDVALSEAFHRLWWKRLTGFWHLVFHYDRADSSCEANGRLESWETASTYGTRSVPWRRMQQTVLGVSG